MANTAVMDAAEEAFIRKLEFVAQKMKDIARMYPHPLQRTSVRVPFRDDAVLLVEFEKPVPMPVMLSRENFYSLLVFEVNRERTISSVKISLIDGRLSCIELYDENQVMIFVDCGASVGLSYLALPEVLRAPKRVRARLGGDDALRWFDEFVSAAEDVSGSDEVDMIDSLDLLNRRLNVDHIEVKIEKPSKDVEGATVDFYVDRNTLEIVLEYIRGPIGPDLWSIIHYEIDGDRVKRVSISAYAYTFKEDGREHYEKAFHLIPRSKIVRDMTEIPDELFDGVVRFTKKFLRAYKVARVALSYMNLSSSFL